MYSRYKIEEPSPPPDYAGTAFPAGRAAPIPPAGGPFTPIGGTGGENPGRSRPDSPPSPTPTPHSGPEPSDRPPDPETDPDFTLSPDEEFPPLAPNLPDSPFAPDSPDVEDSPDAPNPPPEEGWEGEPSEPDSSDSPETPENAPQTPDSTGEDANEGESEGGSLFDRLSPDDLLFVGAMLYLLSGKNGNDSFLLLAYLLTCGL